jgi:uncharacterized protein (TIGR03435 family)
MSALSGGRFEARQQTVENLARVAYGFEHVDPRRGVVARGRNFTTGEYRFDITAVAEEEWSRPTDGEVVPPELRAMLRTLLEERFQLEVRIQTKKVGVYALRLTDRRGELGPGLLPSANECLGPYTEAPRRVAEAVPRCAFRFEPSRIEAGALTMADVARLVSRIDGIQVDRPIVDDTGLTSTYDLSLSLAVIEIGKSTRFIVSEPTTTGEPGGPRAMLADRRPITVRDALKNQLGLKLEAAKLPIKTLLIERAKHPKED